MNFGTRSLRFSVLALAAVCFIAMLGMNDAYVIQPRTMQKGKFLKENFISYFNYLLR
jgi:hypothetical protein